MEKKKKNKEDRPLVLRGPAPPAEWGYKREVRWGLRESLGDRFLGKGDPRGRTSGLSLRPPTCDKRSCRMLSTVKKRRGEGGRPGEEEEVRLTWPPGKKRK